MMKKIIAVTLFLLFSVSIAIAEESRVHIPVNDSPSLGPVDAPVTIVEFLDFQ